MTENHDNAILAAIERLSQRFDTFQARFERVETRLDAMDKRFERIEARLGAVENQLAAVRDKIDAQPDMRLLGHQIEVLIKRVGALEEKNARAISAINDFARENVTPGEVEALHSGLSEVRSIEFDFDVRLRRVEAELHLT
jgi:chromosome segregation ATPase